MDGLLGGAALAVDRRPGDRLRVTGGEDRVAPDVEGLLADLHHAAHDHIVDERRVEVVALDEGLEGSEARSAACQLRSLPLRLPPGCGLRR